MISQVGKALSKAAGPKLQEECDDFIQKNGQVAVGSVTTTRGYNLKSKHVLHATMQSYNSRSTDKSEKVRDEICMLCPLHACTCILNII